jgi:23S rRNA pseudouridine2605 synthase
MPRRNESGPGRRGSSRSEGRPNSGKSRTSGKPLKKSNKDGSKRFSSPPQGKRSERSGTTRTGFDKDARRPGNFGARRSSDRKEGFDSSSRISESKGLSKKSRFAKTAGKTYGSASSPSRKGAAGRSGGKTSDSLAGATKSKRPSSDREEKRQGRGESFGKPYKRTYKVKAGRDFSTASDTKRKGEGQAAKADNKIRLNKFIANSGISSRREADELITLGLISVNGKVVSELGYKVNPGDEVRYEDKVLRAEKPVYILMNKPKGFLTTTDDPQERKTVMHIVGSSVKERIYPVGRLDRNTTGLLLLTNDGDLADKLMHPSFNVKKVYKVELDKPLTKADFQAVVDGVRLEEGRAQVDNLAIVSEDGRTVGIELHIGWNRVVRRIFESLGYEVLKLDRTVYAGLDKKELARGQWRFLTKEEIIHLKHFK